MGVGDSQDFPFELPGPLPAGAYTIAVDGYQASADARLRFDLLWRPAGSLDASRETLLGSVEGRADDADAGLTMGKLRAVIDLPAVPAQCGDVLVLRVDFVSGGSNYLEFIVGMTIP